MIEYIINSAKGTTVYQTDQITHVSMFNLNYVKKLCHEALFSMEGYHEAIRKRLGITYNIPIYIHDELMLIQTKRMRDYDNIWINAAAIQMVKETDSGICIVFLSGRKIYLSLALNRFKARLKCLIMIRNLKVKHFHVHPSFKCLELVI